MDEILEALAVRFIKTLDLNEDIEENYKKIIKVKLTDIVGILSGKGHTVNEYDVQEKLLNLGEKLFKSVVVQGMEKHLPKFFNFMLWEAYQMNIIKDNSLEYSKHHLHDAIDSEKVRKNYYSIISLLSTDLIERYCKGLYQRKGYGHIHLFAKPIHNPKLLEEFLKFAAFFFPIGLDAIKVEGKTVYIDEYLSSKENLRRYFEILKKYVPSQMASIPEPVFRTGVEASINKLKLNFDAEFHVRSDLMRILLFLVKFKQTQNVQVNKRAESPERSLFSLFQKQAGFLGLDRNMLHEVELISRENNW